MCTRCMYLRSKDLAGWQRTSRAVGSTRKSCPTKKFLPAKTCMFDIAPLDTRSYPKPFNDLASSTLWHARCSDSRWMGMDSCTFHPCRRWREGTNKSQQNFSGAATS